MPTRRATWTIAAVLLLAGGAACSSDEKASDGRSPDEVLAEAKAILDETSGVSLSLTTDDLPDGVIGILAAEGVATHAPAFEGTITVPLAGSEFQVPVIAVDGTVYAQIPVTPGWSDVDPSEYGAPDPATLMSTDSGFSSLLTATEDVEEGESVRGGADNAEVLTELSGTVPGETVANVIPTAEGDFDATYAVSAEGELREAVLTGVFYPGTEAMTYTIGFDDYGSEPEISAP